MRIKGLLGAGLLLFAGTTCLAGAHTWDVNEAFSNADGSIWFIELREGNGTSAENGVGGQILSSTTNMVSICILSDGAPCSVSGDTANRLILFGNPGYAELAAAQGAPPPDQIVAVATPPFFNVAGDTLKYNPSVPYDTWTFGAVPVDGVSSMNRIGGVDANTPGNYLGATGSVDASSSPPSVVPDGTVGVPMTVAKLDSSGSMLRLSWDVGTCALNSNHQIIFGDRSDLPSSLGGTYSPSGGVCAIGGASPYTWLSTPNATDGSGLIWWLIVVNNDSNTEGSWGNWEDPPVVGGERQGPGLNGSSGQCGVTDKDLANTCGS